MTTLAEKEVIIFKYEIDLCAPTTLELPVDAKVLTGQFQGKKICLWIEIDLTAPKVQRQFIVFGTGMKFWERQFKYISTIQEPGFVWHIYEVNIDSITAGKE